MHECTFEFTTTREGDLFCKFCYRLMKSDKMFMVEAHRLSAAMWRFYWKASVVYGPPRWLAGPQFGPSIFVLNFTFKFVRLTYTADNIQPAIF